MMAEKLKEITERVSMPFLFKASYDKANRTSLKSFRGPGMDRGLSILGEVRREVGIQVTTDIHCKEEAGPAAEVVDLLQIPAFLCRQTDLLLRAGQTGKPVNIKKGQFVSPEDIRFSVEKVYSTKNSSVSVTERGTSFGYHNLVCDFRSIPIIQGFGIPLIFDATHSVQLPGGLAGSSGGEREMVPCLCRAAVAAGCDGLFLEVHEEPGRAPCDGPNMIPLEELPSLLEEVLRIREAIVKR